jgi:heme-degrading monooxygenase HmoA
MYALFFEVRPKPGHLPHYFEHVDRLRPALARHQGLLFLDRYRSLSDEAVLLSHQHWRDEAAILAWRRDSLHLQSQQAGRYAHFADYRIRVASLVCQWVEGQFSQAAQDDLKGPDPGRFVIAAYSQATDGQVPANIGFQSVNRQGAFISLQEVASRSLARMPPSNRSMASGENRLGVPPPMNTLCTVRPQISGSAASRSAISASR